MKFIKNACYSPQFTSRHLNKIHFIGKPIVIGKDHLKFTDQFDIVHKQGIDLEDLKNNLLIAS
jgi:hypothetical protein